MVAGRGTWKLLTHTEGVGAPGCMDDALILDVGIGIHPDCIQVPSQNCTIPDTDLHASWMLAQGVLHKPDS